MQYDSLLAQSEHADHAQSICLELMYRAFVQCSPGAFDFAHMRFGVGLLRKTRRTSAFRMLTYLEGEVGEDILQQTYARMIAQWQKRSDFKSYFSEKQCSGVVAYLQQTLYACVKQALRDLDTRSRKDTAKSSEAATSETPGNTPIPIVSWDDLQDILGKEDEYPDLDWLAAISYIRWILTEEQWMILFARRGLDLPPRELTGLLNNSMNAHNLAQTEYLLRKRLHCDPKLCTILGIPLPDDCD
jgi:hypothetical protein